MQKGLSTGKAEEKLEEYGYNELKDNNKTTPLQIFLRRFQNVLLWILIFAATVSLIADKLVTFYFIAGIVGIIIVTGFVQEWKAEKAMEALEEMSAPETKVYRDGKITEKKTKFIVPGDIIKLEVGDKVPADAEVVEQTNLKIDESVLTGENLPVEKYCGDKVFSGTVISHGRCEARVTETGMDTELGGIADEVQGQERDSPLQKRIHDLGRRLGVIAVALTTIIFIVGMFQGAPTIEILMVTLALAVATVPEALPLTLTLTLSVGVKSMAHKNAIVKKMLAVEGLGSTTVICTDKTGTLTKNEMTVEKIFVNEHELNVKGRGYRPVGSIKEGKEEVKTSENTGLDWLVKISALCNNADLNFEDGNISLYGDPTEAALVSLAEKTDYSYENLREDNERVEEILFTPERKKMTTLNKVNGETYALMKGAPEKVVNNSKYIHTEEGVKELTDEKKEDILEKNNEFAGQALRVLGFAYKKVGEDYNKEEVEEDMVFVGLAGMMDPPRESVKHAVQECKAAGIKVKMITGDNKETARAIAKQINLTDNPQVLTQDDLGKLTDEEAERKINEVDVFARTHPENKLHIVETLQDEGEVVAMTGDGVNDAPAVKKADVGIGMGEKGTDVTKEASDIILEDDNFETIVDAVRNGRTIYNNIEKFTTYLISRNFTEILLIALVIGVLGFEYLPLIALQILFLNVIGEEAPSLALGVDPPIKGIMQQNPRDPEQSLLNKRNMFYIISMALFMVALAFGVFMLESPLENLETARTMVFATVSAMIIVHSFNFRSLDRSVFKIDPFNNKWIIAAIILTTGLVLSAVYMPWLSATMEHVPLTMMQWAYAVGAAVITGGFIEVLKVFGKKIPKN